MLHMMGSAQLLNTMHLQVELVAHRCEDALLRPRRPCTSPPYRVNINQSFMRSPLVNSVPMTVQPP